MQLADGEILGVTILPLGVRCAALRCIMASWRLLRGLPCKPPSPSYSQDNRTRQRIYSGHESASIGQIHQVHFLTAKTQPAYGQDYKMLAELYLPLPAQCSHQEQSCCCTINAESHLHDASFKALLSVPPVPQAPPFRLSLRLLLLLHRRRGRRGLPELCQQGSRLHGGC